MARASKPGGFLNVVIGDELMQRVNECGEITGQAKTVIVERAIKEYCSLDNNGTSEDNTDSITGEVDING